MKLLLGMLLTLLPLQQDSLDILARHMLERLVEVPASGIFPLDSSADITVLIDSGAVNAGSRCTVFSLTSDGNWQRTGVFRASELAGRLDEHSVANGTQRFLMEGVGQRRFLVRLATLSADTSPANPLLLEAMAGRLPRQGPVRLQLESGIIHRGFPLSGSLLSSTRAQVRSSGEAGLIICAPWRSSGSLNITCQVIAETEDEDALFTISASLTPDLAALMTAAPDTGNAAGSELNIRLPLLPGARALIAVDVDADAEQELAVLTSNELLILSLEQGSVQPQRSVSIERIPPSHYPSRLAAGQLVGVSRGQGKAEMVMLASNGRRTGGLIYPGDAFRIEALPMQPIAADSSSGTVLFGRYLDGQDLFDRLEVRDNTLSSTLFVREDVLFRQAVLLPGGEDLLLLEADGKLRSITKAGERRTITGLPEKATAIAFSPFNGGHLLIASGSYINLYKTSEQGFIPVGHMEVDLDIIDMTVYNSARFTGVYAAYIGSTARGEPVLEVRRIQENPAEINR